MIDIPYDILQPQRISKLLNDIIVQSVCGDCQMCCVKDSEICNISVCDVACEPSVLTRGSIPFDESPSISVYSKQILSQRDGCTDIFWNFQSLGKLQ